MNQPATPLVSESPAFDRGIREQMEMTRRAIAAGEDKQLQDAVHPARWERRGLFRGCDGGPGSARWCEGIK